LFDEDTEEHFISFFNKDKPITQMFEIKNITEFNKLLEQSDFNQAQIFL